MGNGIAQIFAQAGFTVRLVGCREPALDPGARRLSRRASRSSSKKGGLRTPREAPPRASHDGHGAREPSPTPTTSSRRSSKTRGQAGAFSAASTRSSAPATILASNTSSISITRSVAATPATRQGTRDALHESGAADGAGRADPRPGDIGRVDARRQRPVRALGKTGVEAADYPGFIANRILMPMLNEAFFAVMEGVERPRRSTAS